MDSKMLNDFYTRTIKSIDSSLEFVEAPWAFNEGFVFRVKREEKDYILKGTNSPMNLWVYQNEEEVLKRAKHVEGITHHVHSYGWVGEQYAFLKEYAPGERLDKANFQKVKERGLKKGLAKTLAKLHFSGVSEIEILPRNIIVSPEYDRLTIIDFNKARVNRGYNLLTFARGVLFDREDLRKLEL